MKPWSVKVRLSILAALIMSTFGFWLLFPETIEFGIVLGLVAFVVMIISGAFN